MTTREYLSSYLHYKGEIEAKDNLVYEIEELLAGGGMKGMQYSERVQTSKNYNPSFVKLYEQLERISEARTRELAEMHIRKDEIVARVWAMENDKFSNVLQKRYIEGKSFKTIAEEMFYDEGSVRHLVCKAVKQFDKLYGQYYENE